MFSFESKKLMDEVTTIYSSARTRTTKCKKEIKYLSIFVVLIILCFIACFFPEQSYANTITVSGLIANNQSQAKNNTQLIQNALNKASQAGGGKVVIPAGKYYLDRLNDTGYSMGYYCLVPQDNVLLTGSTSTASDTVLYPLITADKTKGLNCFYFDGAGNHITDSRDFVDNADFENFTIDGKYAAIANGSDYIAAGKGFSFYGFKNCDWNNVQVLNTDGTGFGVDFPINCTMKNCYAEKCGKAARLTGANVIGASGFGIGVGYNSQETMVIENCSAVENANFGFFFEHQRRFNANIKTFTSKKYHVKNCIAYGNLHNFGGTRTQDTYYYNCQSKKDTNASFEAMTTDSFVFENYSVRSNFVKCTIEQTPTDISGITSTQKTAMNWALKEGIVTVGGVGNADRTKFRPNDQIAQIDYLLMLYRAFDHSQDNVPNAGDGDELKNAVKSELGGSIPSDIDLSQYYGQAYRWAKLNGFDLDGFELYGQWNGNGQKIANWLTTLSTSSKYKSYFKSTNPTQIAQYRSNSIPTTRISCIENFYLMLKDMTPTAPSLVTTPVPNSEDGGYISLVSTFTNSVLGSPSSFPAVNVGFYLNGTQLKGQVSYLPGRTMTSPLLPLGTYTVRAITQPNGYSVSQTTANISNDGATISCSLNLTIDSGTATFNATSNGVGVAAGTYTIKRQSNSETIGDIVFPANGKTSKLLYPDTYTLIPSSLNSPYIDANIYNFTVTKDSNSTVNVILTTPLDTNAITEAINQAEQLLSNVSISENGLELQQGQQYVSEAVAQDLQDAIEQAREIASVASEQGTIDSALAALNSAIAVFRSNIQIAAGPLDLSQFNAKLSEANGLLSTNVSENGLDLAPGQQYATKNMIDTLSSIIEQVNSSVSDFIEQDSVDAATKKLSDAINTFKTNMRTATGPISTSSLSEAMSKAQALIDETPVSTDGKGLSKGQKYATPSAVAYLQSALDKANEEYPNVESQDEADNLKSMLEAAIQTFMSDLKTAPCPVDTSLVQASIEEANKLLSSTAVSKDGTDITRGTKYVTSSVKNTLQNAVNKAKTDISNAKSQIDADNINKILRTAIQKFKNSIKTAQGPIEIDLLGSAIENANKLLKNTKISNSGKTLKKGTKYVIPITATTLRNAINKANTTYENPKSQSSVDKSEQDLQKAISSFNLAILISEGPFKDVDPNAWYKDAIDWANENNLLTGYKETNLFGPNDRLTRGQAAVILWRYYEPVTSQKYIDSKGKNSTPFVDNLNGQYYTEAINWTYKNKIFTGYSGTNIVGINDSLTRQQLCTIIYRCSTQISHSSSKYSMSKFNTFPDKGQVASYAVSQVAWCVDKGIITGWDNRLLAPEMIVDRAQMSKVMMNVVQNKIIK